MLKDRGGLEYKFLQVDFPEDIARRNALDITRKKSPQAPAQKIERKKRKTASHKPK